MKKLINFLTIAIFMLFVQNSFGQITNSAHDFNGKSWNTTGEICVVCHTPHNANTSVADAPLWNHELSIASYTPYTSATLDATVGQPDNSSKLCLSCHDGTVALENFGGTNNGNSFISGSKNLGTDLSDDHPISFTYDAALALLDGSLFDPTNTNSGLGGTIDENMLINGQMQCASCHDVHNTNNNPDLLVKNNSNSALCLTCHNK